MPICEIDPWRLQYFTGANCPREVNVPTEDSDAWRWNPAHRWVYDKLAIARSQRLAAGLHGTEPPRFPVFSKPRINLRGMGVGGRVLDSRSAYRRHLVPGHMWMPLLAGDHVSSDAAVVAGKVHWWRHATGLPAGEGTFDYWIVHAEPDAELEIRLARWIARQLPDYTGMLNLETIGGVIIEVHLRITDQWPDLYGSGWVDAVVGLYHRGEWTFAEAPRRDGFSVALFGSAERRYRHPPPVVIEEILRMADISSVQITFHEDLDPASHAMPPGGFRLAVVNCHNLGAGVAARQRLRECFEARSEPGRSPQRLTVLDVM